ncbi:MAG: glycine zipper family protein, partial [Pseudomonadota bacterium]
LAIITLLIGSGVTAGCANTSAGYEPLIDGAKTAAYQSDLQACQSLAGSRYFDNGDVRTEALLGATFGALVGALDEGSDGLMAGAVAGSIIGGAERAWDVRDERKAIVVKCLTNRGHNVVG